MNTVPFEPNTTVEPNDTIENQLEDLREALENNAKALSTLLTHPEFDGMSESKKQFYLSMVKKAFMDTTSASKACEMMGWVAKGGK